MIRSLQISLVFLFLLAVALPSIATSQSKPSQPTPESLGFQHLSLRYRGEDVHILLATKPGDERKPKPLFFFCQGSLPQPLIRFNDDGAFGVLPFKMDALLERYHVAIVGKPGIPLSAHASDLDAQMSWHDSSGQAPKRYSENNHLDYYTGRNKAVISYLLKKSFIAKSALVVAGHSEGSTVAAKMAATDPRVTHLIYLSGNPMGRIMTMIEQQRAREIDTAPLANEEIEYWKYVVADRVSNDRSNGDSPKTTYSFSVPPIETLMKLSLPVWVAYGTKDLSAPFNDYLQVETIRKDKTNFTFRPYIGAEHNFFPVRADGTVNYDVFNWDSVIREAIEWISAHPAHR